MEVSQSRSKSSGGREGAMGFFLQDYWCPFSCRLVH